MLEHTLNQTNPFIRGYYVDPAVCDALAEQANSASLEPDTLRKYSYTWLETFPDGVKAAYVDQLFGCVEQYKQEFEYCYTGLNRWTLKAGVKVQKYMAGDHYSHWHCENGGYFETVSRNLVFMTYLNDISDQGGTEFLYQQLAVKPEKGLTLIWPADWTHIHRGMVSRSQEKLVTTGWFVYDLTDRYNGVY